jgi:hypothetical protein
MECRMRRTLFLAVLFLAGCAQLPLTPADLQARNFEPVPGKSVVYVVRDDPDFSREPAAITLDDATTLTTYPGSYYRWEAAPGQHLIQGFAGHAGRIVFPTEAGRVYFVQQRVSAFFPFGESFFALVPEPHARAIVARSVLVGGP